jgi:hypothetical protein
VVDNLIDVVFLIDMTLMIVTSAIDMRTGREVKDQQLIIHMYVSSMRFVFDVLALFGTGIITQFIPVMKVFKCAKIVRVFRLGKVIAELNIDTDKKMFLLLGKLVFFLFLWIHVVACIWWIVIYQNRDSFLDVGVSAQWYAPFDWANFEESIIF